jgi:hypothetical protein
MLEQGNQAMRTILVFALLVFVYHPALAQSSGGRALPDTDRQEIQSLWLQIMELQKEVSELRHLLQQHEELSRDHR